MFELLMTCLFFSVDSIKDSTQISRANGLRNILSKLHFSVRFAFYVLLKWQLEFCAHSAMLAIAVECSRISYPSLRGVPFTNKRFATTLINR